MIQQVPATFSLDELLSYLREEEHTEGYRTAQEWAAHFEVNVRRMRELLGEAKKAGLLQCNMANRERLDGRYTPVPVYAFDLGERE
jgi:hypothetical protein